MLISIPQETYLLQTRMQKMPYKHIAAQLKKTELACRLHYHQLCHGSHRRRRTTSISSTISSSSVSHASSCLQYSPPSEQKGSHTAESSHHGSPSMYRIGSTSPPSSTSVPVSVYNKPILPKCQPGLVTPRTSPEPNLHHLSGLRINTAEHILQRPSTVTSIDTDRLRAIYEARRAAFWASIAAEYGQDVSPIHLEQVWRQTCNVARPLTPPEDGNSHFKARPLPPLYAQPAASASERLQGRLFDTTPTTAGVSAVSAPERLQYTLPTLTPSTTGTGTPSMSLSRASTWSETSSVPATAIAALLTVDKEPRPDVDADTIMHG